MSTYEATVSMLQDLPESDLQKVKAYIIRIINRREIPVSVHPFSSLSREEIFEQLETARKHAEAGYVMDGHLASSIVREKYGL